MIEFITEDIDKVSIDLDKIQDWLDNIIEAKSMLVGDICFIFCSDKYLLDINIEYLNHDFYTDVITFDYCESNIVSGDIFISIDRIIDNSKSLSTGFTDELLRVIVHGVLHLLGFDDKSVDDKKIMTSEEDKCLKIYSDVG